MNKIAIVIPWYGSIPNYFPLFIKGLEFNEDTLDVLFITDCEITTPTPSNFKKHNLPWEELVKRIKERIHPNSNIVNAYKLCDFRPMFGKIFEEEIKSYTHWGYGDIDLIYGDLNVFLPFDGIENYDVITFRENVIHGPFSIFKNNDYINNLYKKTNKLEMVVTAPRTIAFDETGRIKPWRTRKRVYTFLEKDNFWDWTSIIQHEADNGKLNLFERYYALEFLVYDSILNFKNGKLFIGWDEYAFFHWVAHKNLFNFIFPKWKSIPNEFNIHSTGFYKKDASFVGLTKIFRNYYGKLLQLKKRIKDSYNYRIAKK